MIKTLKKNPTLLHMAIFAFAFSFIGWALPQTYYKYIDDTDYLVVRYPMSVEPSEVEACDDITVFSTYTALDDIQAISYNDWMRLNEDGTYTKVDTTSRSGNFPKGEGETFSVDLEVPCRLDPGTYFISGVKKYTHKDAERSYSFITDAFHVEEKDEN